MSNSEAVEEERSVEELSLNTEKVVEASKSTLEAQLTQPSDECTSEKSSWLVGDIVWSKIPGHPWWPSMIAYEPNTAVYFKYKGRAKYFHVQFFGTEPLRGWVTERNILKYEGKSHFLSLRLSVHGKPHKIGNKQLPLWETAVKMADKAVPLNRHERQLCFTFKYNESEKPNSSIEPTPDHVAGVLEDKQSKASSTPGSGKKRSKHAMEKVCNGSDDMCEPPIKKTKIDKNVLKNVVKGLKETDSVRPHNSSPTNKQGKNTKRPNSETPKQTKTTPGKQAKNKLDKQVKNKLEKQVKNKEIKNKPFKPIVVKHSPTACTVQMNINPQTPEQGKRKRGRPRKDLLFLVNSSEGKDEKAVTLAKKPRTEKQSDIMKILQNNLGSTSCESEKSDVASDTNSTSSMDIESRSNKSTLKTKDYVCTVCEQPDNLLICEGVCNSAYHKDCLGLTCDVLPEKFICDECTSGNHTCFICRKTNNVVKCSSLNCGKFYHLDCIKTVDPKIINENFICPLHHCNVCGTSKSLSVKRRLTCCTRCPVAYHSGTCIVAGSLPITTQYLVCKRHFMADKKKAHHSHVNVNWCFVCSIGGTLICCETCPAAFHPECIQEAGIPEGCFFCRDCKDGKELLYGEIVWVKLGMYRWWPAQICNPNNIPTNIQKMQHQPGEFPVQFLGSRDYYWIHRGRVFSYQEGDKGSIKSGGKYLAEIFKKALDEAKEKYAEWQKAQEEKAEKDLEKLSKKPAVYKHIKVNRYTTATRYVIDESDMSTCDCTMNDENPCGPDSHCLNRILYVECSPLKCHAKEKCQNQCFVKRQDLDCEPFRAERRGWGLRAKADAKKGQFVIEYVGELINEETCRERVRKGINDGVINYYMLTIDKDCIIDAGPMGNLSRFMNHSCDPNCETQKWRVNGDVRVGLFAKRDIKAGEELVFDYQLDCLGNEKKKCSCGSENCSGFLGVRPKTQHALKLQEEKKKNQESKKKKKKNGSKKNPAVVDEHEDECFDCGDGGELIMCSKSGCSKCYHLSCLTLDKIPYGNWQCPWHFCDDCGKAAMLRCDECSNSFCLAHAPGQIAKTTNGRYLCDQHPENGLDTTDLVNPDISPEYSANTSSEPANISSDPTNTSNDPTNTSNDPTNTSSDPTNTSNDPTNTSNDPTNTSSDPTNTSSDYNNTSSDPTNTSSEPTNISNDPTNTSSDPTNTSTDFNNASSDPTNISTDPNNTSNDPTNTSTDPTNTSGDLANTSGDPINTSSVPTSTSSDPISTSSDCTSASNGPTNTSSDPNKTREDPDGIPGNIMNIHTQTGCVPLNPLDEPSTPSSIPTSPSSVLTSPTTVSKNPSSALTDPTNAPIDPTFEPINPTNNLGGPTNLPKDPGSNHEDLLKNPISVPKIHVVS